MIKAARLAGFLAAHSFMNVLGGDRHIVNYGRIDKNGQEYAERIKQGMLTVNVKAGQRKILQNPVMAASAVLVYNCMGDLMPVPDSFYAGNDIMFIEIMSYKDGRQAIFGLRYEMLEHRIALTNLEIYFLSEGVRKKNVLKSFWDGFAEHECGADIFSQTDQRLLDVKKHRYGDTYLLLFSKISYGVNGVLSKTISPSDISRKFDDVGWHSSEGLRPGESGDNTFCVHIGIFAIWCAINGFAGGELKRKVETIRKIHLNRTGSPGMWCLDKMDGQLTNEDLNDEGNAFACWYYDGSGGMYVRDYIDVFGDDRPEFSYDVPDNWKSYDIIAPIITRRLHEWRSGLKK